MGHIRAILWTVTVVTILVFGSVFEENILPVVESQLPTTLKIIKLTTGGDDTFDFTITGPTSYNSSINTDSGGAPPIGEIVILNEIQHMGTNNSFEIDFTEEFGVDSLVGQEVTFSGQVPTKIRINNMHLRDFANNDAALQFRIYSNYTFGVTEFQDLVLEASSDILFANATDYEVGGDSISPQFNFTSAPSLTGTFAVSLVATNPNWFQGSEAQIFEIYEDGSLIPGDCFSVEDITNPSSIIGRDSGGEGHTSCEDFPFKVFVQTTTNPRILWDDYRENYGHGIEFDVIFGTTGAGDHYIVGNRVNLTDSTILTVTIPAFQCSTATNGTLVAKIWDIPTVGSTTIPIVHATSDTWGVIVNANSDCSTGGLGPNNVFDVTFNFTAAPELTGEYFIGIETDDFNDFTVFDIFYGNSIAYPLVPYDPIVFVGYNATDGWVEEILTANADEILGLRMSVIQNQSGASGGGMGIDGPSLVDPGTYSIQETIPAGWTLTSATCNDGSSSFSVDTVSDIVIDSGDSVECTFENEFASSDTDGDGILDDVDTLPNTVSDDFSDVDLGGTTSGTITTRGNQTLTITEEPNPDGVRITADVSGGLLPAIINTCSGSSIINLSPGDDIVVSCGSVTIDVTSGTVEVTFELGDGTDAVTAMPEGNSITFDSDNYIFSVPALNNDSIIIIINDLELTLDSGTTISLGFLQINKQTTSGDDTFDFSVTGPTSYDTSIVTDSGVGVDGPILVVSGTYSIQEIIPDGWGLVEALCGDDSSTFSGDTVSDIVVNAGINIVCTFENEFVGSIPDTDSDGILDDVDTLPNTVSDDFSDVDLGGTTSGTITTRGNQTLTISEEANPEGIRIIADVSGGLLPAVVDACGGISIIALSPGDNIVVTCSSVTIDVTSGTVEVTFVGSGGIEATSSLTAGNSITFDPDTLSFSVPPTNSDPVVVIVDGDQVILNPGQSANVLSPAMDSFIKQGELNTNEGANAMMRVRDNGNNRALVSFDQDEILAAAQERTLSSATLRLYIEENGNNWGPDGRTIDIHRLLDDWAQGNGFNDKPENMPLLQFNELKTRGDGMGVTWKCATDTEINNQQPNCNPEWNGATFSLTPTDTITVFKDNPPTGTIKTVGWIEFDVTADLEAFLSTEQNYGWIVKKTEEGATGLVEFTSGESTTNIPELVLVFN